MEQTLDILARLEGTAWLGLGPLQQHIDAGLAAAREDEFGRRIWARDGSLWSSDPAVISDVESRLGWLELPTAMRVDVPRLEALLVAVQAAGLQRAVLLGMGGSSLAAETMSRVLGVSPRHLPLTVLDSTDPAQVRRVADEGPLDRTLFIVSSKSGTTAEVDALYRYFSRRLADAAGSSPPPRQEHLVPNEHPNEWRQQFVAITDPGTPLERLAREEGFRAVYLNPPDIGGRFSALSLFGLVPAALIGADLERLLERARAMAWACRGQVAPEENPGIRLGVLMGECARYGRDKLTLLTSPELAAFGPWAEQLIAESTGKHGVGILPVEGEPLLDAASYRDDRLFAYLRLEGADNGATDAHCAALVAAGHPVVAIRLNDAYDLGAEFYRWEFATAVAGQRLGINPFDQPNVDAAKDRAREALARYAQEQTLPEEAPALQEGDLALYGPPLDAASVPAYLRAFMAQAGDHDYVALIAYMDRTEAHDALLQSLRRTIANGTRLATTVGFGPRFLHSTGQLHKGGPGTGLFLQITHADADDIPVPGAGYTFGILKRAQALGDLLALRDVGRRVVRVHLQGDVASGLDALGVAMGTALS